ncbi:BgtE-10119 [Blumeria graminis f. sp. tritici]|uniref:BgtE-10119 n=3 Tax=Blumeria graminis TaxID=34373 RepID=A0A9X9MNI8_BLUGR|nr:putative secreted effector protein [Blumeria graminis f. sp. tritici 96224]VDB94468.1 BgtE-10119 [Blumeria graminis f. sp. tritici]
MKGLSPLHLILTSLLVYAISANVVESDFVCERDIVPKDRINTAIFHACSSFSDLTNRNKFPAEFDPSTTHFIEDAILFSWPVTIDGDHYIKGHAGKFRLLIDSSCKFYGMVKTIKDEPVLRCYQPVKSENLYELSSSSGPRKQSILRAYRCENEIFDMPYIKITVKAATKPQQAQKHGQTNFRLQRYTAIDELFQTTVYVVPNEVASKEYHKIEDFLRPYFIVIDSQFKMLDMVFKKNNIWARCDKLLENEPEPRHSFDITTNSIGEINFLGVTSYMCGSYKFTQKSVNSHMQLGCNVVQQLDKSSITLNGYQNDGDLTSTVGTFTTVKQSLKLPEAVFPSIGRGGMTPNKSMIFFDKNCNFLGAFWFHQKKIHKCIELSP